MTDRIAKELELLRRYYPDLVYEEKDRWFCIPSYPLPEGWNRGATDVAFQVKVEYPGTPPYGILVPAGLTSEGKRPDNYTEPASPLPPFGGSWGVFSWSPDADQWRPTADLVAGSNLLNWVRSFADRFREGA